jgi:hypothetical protein
MGNHSPVEFEISSHPSSAANIMTLPCNMQLDIWIVFLGAQAFNNLLGT